VPLVRRYAGRRFTKATRRQEREANRRARRRLGNALGGDFERATEAFRSFTTARVGGGPAEVRPLIFELPMATFRGRLRTAFVQRLDEAVNTGAQIGMRYRPPAFPRVSREAVREVAASFIDAQAATAVQGITTQTRAGIRRSLLEALADRASPTATFARVGELAGLTDRQVRAVSNFRRTLERQLVPTERARTAQIEALLERRTNAFRDRLLRARGRLIGETEMQRALQAGERGYYEVAAAEGAVDLEGVEKTWFTVQDERVCPICEPLHGETVAFEDLFDTAAGGLEGPPAHPACLPGDALVSTSGRIAAQFRRWFDGELVVLETAGGHRLRLTPNHPVLTDRGWIAAELLDQGDHVVECQVVERAAGVVPQHQHVPVPAEQVFETLRRARGVSATKVPGATEDFHGDGRRGQVEIVRTDRLLWRRLNAALEELTRDPALQVALLGRALAAHGRAFLLELAGVAPAVGRVGCLHLAGALALGHAIPLQTLGLGLGTEDAGLPQPLADRGDRATERLGELRRRGAVRVTRDELIRVQREEFRGHVYNFETYDGFYAANSILVHNCRCFLQFSGDEALVEDEAAEG